MVYPTTTKSPAKFGSAFSGCACGPSRRSSRPPGRRVMIVQIRIQVITVEDIDNIGIFGVDVPVADVFTDDSPVLGLH